MASGMTVAAIALCHQLDLLSFPLLLALVFLGALLDAPGGTARAALVPDLAKVGCADRAGQRLDPGGRARLSPDRSAAGGVLIAVFGPGRRALDRCGDLRRYRLGSSPSPFPEPRARANSSGTGRLLRGSQGRPGLHSPRSPDLRRGRDSNDHEPAGCGLHGSACRSSPKRSSTAPSRSGCCSRHLAAGRSSAPSSMALLATGCHGWPSSSPPSPSSAPVACRWRHCLRWQWQSRSRWWLACAAGPLNPILSAVEYRADSRAHARPRLRRDPGRRVDGDAVGGAGRGYLIEQFGLPATFLVTASATWPRP